MVVIDLEYQGDLRCDAVHPSGTHLSTDAPIDNQGKGESFSPSDLVATALGSCMMTIMGIVGRRHQLNLAGLKVRVEKHMINEPVRRIGKLSVTFQMPEGLAADKRQLLQNAAFTCPVHKSLHPDIETPVVFNYPD